MSDYKQFFDTASVGFAVYELDKENRSRALKQNPAFHSLMTPDILKQLEHILPDQNSGSRLRISDSEDGMMRDFRILKSSAGKVFVEVTPVGNTTEQMSAAADLGLVQTVLDSLRDSIYVKDREGRKILLNSACAKNMGMNIEEAAGKTDFDVFPKEIAEKFWADDLTVLTTGNPVINREELLKNEEEKKRWSLTTKLPMVDADGNVTGIIGIGRDITAIKSAQDALRQSEQQYRDLVEHAFSAIVIVKDDGIFYANPSFEKMIGIGADELMGTKLVDLFDPAYRETLESDLLKSKNEAAVIRDSEIQLRNKSGQKIIADMSCQPLMFSGEQMIMLMLADITQRKHQEVRLRQYSEQLKDINAQKDRFFSIIAHDLKSPFFGLLNVPQMLLDEFNEMTPAEIKSSLMNIHMSIKNLYKLIENLLDWSRLQTGRMQFAPARFLLHEKIQKVFSFLLPLAERKNLVLENSVSDTVVIHADENMISSVLQNLTTNAIKFSFPFGTIKISAREDRERIVMSISDQGIGIPKDIRNRLFRLDEYISTKGTDNETGTGLGLIYCKDLIERHNGAIWIEDDENRGTTISFSLPNT